MKNESDYEFNAALIIIIVFLIIIVALHLDDTRQYNGGTCLKCGGHYEFLQAVGHRNTTEYIYKCDKCGNMIKTAFFMEEK